MMLNKPVNFVGASTLLLLLLLACPPISSVDTASYSASTLDHDHYVDPSDMGSYSHSLQKNVLKKQEYNKQQQHEIEEIRETRTTYYRDEMDSPEGAAYLLKYPASQSSEGDVKMEILERSVKFKENAPCGICPTIDDSAVMIYTKRIIASLLSQMNAQNRVFGPKETITIDLRAELSHDDFTKLKKFTENSSKHSQGVDNVVQVDTISQLATIADVIGNLLYVVYPEPQGTVLEYLQEKLNYSVHSVLDVKFWISSVTLFSVAFLILIFLYKAYTSTRPLRMLFYIFLVFFIVSCITVFYDLQEQARAENSARLHQYDSIPKDCKYNEFGIMDKIGYYFRVHVFNHKDQCVEYHKQIRGDLYFHVSAVEAISEAFSRLVFHPMEYIGGKVGKLLGGIVSVVPFWLKPALLLLIFLFGFLALCRYTIVTPFFRIEPARAKEPTTTRYLLEESPMQDEQQKIMKKNRSESAIVGSPTDVKTASKVHVATSTDDLDFANNRFSETDWTSNSKTCGSWTAFLFNCFWALSTFVAQILSFLLRAVPQTQRLVINEETGAFEVTSESDVDLQRTKTHCDKEVGSTHQGGSDEGCLNFTFSTATVEDSSISISSDSYSSGEYINSDLDLVYPKVGLNRLPQCVSEPSQEIVFPKLRKDDKKCKCGHDDSGL